MSQKKDADNKEPLISLLINSAYYFIDCVFILREEGLFRLIVLHNGVVLKDSYYRTAKGARVAFQKQFKRKAWTDAVKAEWSCFYPPELNFLCNKAA